MIAGLPDTTLPVTIDDLDETPPLAGGDGAVRASKALMGGQVSVHVRPSSSLSASAADRAARLILGRIEAWAARLTRFDPASELSRMNGAPTPTVGIGPTLTAVLDWGRGAEILSDGIVDVGLLDARLRAEGMDRPSEPPSPGSGRPATRHWSLRRHGRGASVERSIGLRFDLDGVAKGWLADRALDLLPNASTVVDADGDVAVQVADGTGWAIGVADPLCPGSQVAVVRLTRQRAGIERFGIATSGTSVHRWATDGDVRHHLIDPRTGHPAQTDVIQATAIASTARAAEAFAKTAVILGSRAARERMARPDVLGLVLITLDGAVVATRPTLRFLA
ncbi:MAG TPA: FAD:protein FMN transferase [Candidatus Limnocylindrales bacterium]